MLHTLTSIGASITLQLFAADFYSRESIAVAPGQVYQVEVLPNQYWTDWWKKSDASGFNNPLANLWGKRVKKTKCFTLCGVYDKNESTGFAIGLQKEIVVSAPSASVLYFFANDSKNYYSNNKGSIMVKITRTK